MPTDPRKRAAVIAECNRFAEAHDGELPALSIEQFFDGNDDLGSIMCNLEPPSIDAIRQQFLKIRSRPDVQAVLISVHETMEEDGDDCWPFAERVVIVTSASDEAVRGWFDESMAPDDIWELEDELDGVPTPRPGFKALVAWWD